MDIHNPQGSFMQGNMNNEDIAGGLKNDLASSLRSFKDSLAFNFQSLNLTLASLNNTIRSTSQNSMTLSGNYQLPVIPSDPRMQMAGAAGGNMLRAMAPQRINTWDLMSAAPAYNMNPTQYWAARDQELAARFTNHALSLGGGVLNGTISGLGMAAGFLGGPIGWIGGTAAQLGVAAVNSGVRQGQERIAAMTNLQRIAPRAGMFLNAHQAGQLDENMVNSSYNELMYSSSMTPKLGISGYRNVAMMGMQSGMIKAGDMDKMSEQINTAAAAVRLITQIMGNKDVQESMKQMQQMQQMGLNPIQQIGQFRTLLSQADRIGNQTGMRAGDILSMGMQYGGAAAGSMGFAGATGVGAMMGNYAFTSELQKRQILTDAQIAMGGGVRSIAANMTQGMASVMKDPTGGQLGIMAGMDSRGRFNTGMYNQAMNGNYFDMLGSAAGNFFSRGPESMYAYLANKDTLTTNALLDPKTGGLTEMGETNVLKQMQVYPFWEQASESMRVNMTSLMLQQKYGMSETAAHVQAMKIVHPTAGRNIAADRNYNRKLLDTRIARTSVMGKINDVMSIPGRVIGYAEYEIGKPFRGAATDIYGLLSTDYNMGNTTDWAGPTLASNASHDIINAGIRDRWGKVSAAEMLGGNHDLQTDIEQQSPSYRWQKMTADSKLQGAGILNYLPGNTMGQAQGLYSLVKAGLGLYSRDNLRGAVTDANLANVYKDAIRDNMSGANRNSGNAISNMAYLQSIAGNNFSISKLRDDVKSSMWWGQGSLDRLSGTITRDIYNTEGSKLSGIAERRMAALGNNYNVDDIVRSTNMSMDELRARGLSTNQLATTLLSNANFKKTYGDKANEAAGYAALKINQDKLGTATEKNDTAIGLMLGDINKRLVSGGMGSVSDIAGSTLEEASRFIGQDISMTGADQAKLLSRLGINGDFLRDANITKFSDIEGQGKTLAALLSVDKSDSKKVNDEALDRSLKSISNPALRKKMSDTVYNIRQNIVKNGNRTEALEGILSADEIKKLGGMSEDERANYITKKISLAYKGAYDQQDINGLENMGGKVSDVLRDQLAGAKDSDARTSIIESALNSGKLGHSRVLDDLKGRFQDINNMDMQTLLAEDDGSGGSIGELYKKTRHKDPTNIDDVRKFAKQYQLARAESIQEAKKDEAASKMDTKIDTIVGGSGESAYARVVIVPQPGAAATVQRGETDKNTVKPKGPQPTTPGPGKGGAGDPSDDGFGGSAHQYWWGQTN